MHMLMIVNHKKNEINIIILNLNRCLCGNFVATEATVTIAGAMGRETATVVAIPRAQWARGRVVRGVWSTSGKWQQPVVSVGGCRLWPARGKAAKRWGRLGRGEKA